MKVLCEDYEMYIAMLHKSMLGSNVARARSEAGAFLGSEASGASFSKNPRKRSVPEASIYIYI
jgi:hypothetical protein